MTQAVTDYLGKDWIYFKEVFFKNLGAEIPLLNKINEYLFSTSGKCLRPMLCLLSAHACSGAASEPAILCAAAAEMIHTATLLHDDVADNDTVRRGKPNVMSLYSPAASVLVGDYWLASAIRTIIDDCDKRVFKSYGKCIEELAMGEMLQMQKSDSLEMSLEDYLSIIDCKTASLFRAAMVGGAFSVDAPQEYVDAVDSYAHHLGRAFQMEDDILDYSPHLDTGKAAGNDIAEQKITLPLLGALNRASKTECEEVVSQIRKGDINEVLSFVENKGGMEYARDCFTNETALAIDALAPLPESRAKALLADLARNLLTRNR